MFVWLFSGDATKTTKHSSNIVDTSVLHSKSTRQPGMSVCVPVCVCVLQSSACRWSVWERVVRPAAGDPPHHLLAAGLGWDGDQPQLVPRPVSHSQGVWLCSLLFYSIHITKLWQLSIQVLGQRMSKITLERTKLQWLIIPGYDFHSACTHVYLHDVNQCYTI